MINSIRKINLPSRFENLKLGEPDEKKLKSFILKNKAAIEHINNVIESTYSSNSGAFLIIKGKSGIGKTTFLRTLNLYIDNVEICKNYEDEEELQKYFSKLNDNGKFKIIMLENRESIAETKYSNMEKDIRSINKFLRSNIGRNSIVVWPCNHQSVVDDIVDLSKTIGGTFLINDETVYDFNGPDIKNYYQILKNTFSIFNNEQDIENYGIDENISDNILKEQGNNTTIGTHLELSRKMVINNIKKINNCYDLFTEEFKLWIVVISNKGCTTEINYLTKGNNRQIDLDRLLHSTSANIKNKFLENKSILKMFTSAIDCKILTINSLNVCNLIKSTKNDKLKELLKENGLTLNEKVLREKLIIECEIVKAIENNTINNERDGKLSDNLEFSKILKISESNDKILNREICEALMEGKHIYSYVLEQNKGEFTTIRSDAHCGIMGNYLELEFMWRTNVSKAMIAEYTLKKIYNYAEALKII